MFQKPLQFLFVCAMLFVSANAFAQKYAISGKVTDAENAQPLFSATIQALGTTDGALTDFDGNYTLELPNGSYKLVFSFIGMTETIKEVTVAGAAQTIDIALGGNKLLEEVKVVADIAKDRATPVAFSNISTIKLKEELAGQDIPMILNSTPGVYATQGGGGVGDARISIRGFSQRNVAVMLDGIPVNDMENGQVYWSNWFGLENNTKAMQVQRGLGASKLAVPSVGGSINILTKGIDDAKSITLSNELGAGNYIRSTLFVNSGRLKGGWGISSAVSFQKQDGIIDKLYSKGFFYYLRIDKQFKKHTLSLSGFGAPQEHGQNNRRVGIGFVDTTLANSLYTKRYDDTKTAHPESYANMGRTYGQGWGRFANGDPIVTLVNYYHKPQFSFRHSWQISPKVFLSNVAYLSIGNGGGVSAEGSGSSSRTNDGEYLFDAAAAFTGNQVTNFNKLGRSNTYLRSSVNNHFWYGLLSTVKYDINRMFSVSGGIDARDFRGDHYRTPYNLLGGNFVQADIPTIGKAQQVKIGDKFTYDNTAFIRWGGAFGLLEFKKDKWSGFLNASGAYTGYKLVDHFKPRILTVDGNVVTRTYNLTSGVQVTKPVYMAAYNGTAANNPLLNNNDNLFKSYTHNGTTYTVDSPEAKKQEFDWCWVPSYTFKIGGAYNINKNHSVFANAGWLSRATRYNNLFLENRTQLNTPIISIANAKNEEIRAVELGYTFRSSKFSANVNGYYTTWQNKPIDNPATTPDPISGEPLPKVITGIGAIHQGVEFDFAYNITKTLTVEGLTSIGDWRWNGVGTSADPTGATDPIVFDPTGVHVGDAAQTQFGAAIRYEPIKGLYFKTRGTYFGNNYANFTPESLTLENERKETWKMPDYYLVDFNTGYSFKIDKKVKAGIRFNLLNVLDAVYISDAQGNDVQGTAIPGQIFSGLTAGNYSTAETATVLFGLPRRWNMSFTLEF